MPVRKCPRNRASFTAYGTKTKTYDAENRLKSDIYPYADPSSATATSYGTAFSDPWLQTIDAVNSYYYQPATISNVDYDASSHPIRITTSAQSLIWLWDGNDRFLQCRTVNGQCTGITFSLEGLADYEPISGTATVYDRNHWGLVASSHTSYAFSSWTDAAGGPRVFPTLPQGECSTHDVTDPSTYCQTLRAGKLTADGWTIDNDTWQGVRTADLSVGQWNIPDAYAGDVHDPMSQKPFMWNRNNPYAYSDPSGYEPGDELRLLGNRLLQVLARSVGRPSYTQSERALFNKIRNVPANAPKITSDPQDLDHMFNSKPGHVGDSSLNRSLLQSVSSDAKYRLSSEILPDGAKFEKFVGDLPSGAQVWADVRDGIIKNGGIRPPSPGNPPANPL